ncbi:DUF2070 family protein [Candidatus Micrarchaeota archaeon]|nr:DUF2070 family protein [Candidatus Micrarchaeota archaeon]
MKKRTEAQRDLKAVSITKLIAPLPSYKKSILIVVVLSFISGFILSVLRTKNLSLPSLGEHLLYGGAEGFLILGLPAIISATFAASLTRKEKFVERLKHFSFLSLISVSIVSLLYIIGLVSFSPANLPTFVLLANSIIFGIWFFAMFVTLSYGWKSLLISLFQPALNISFLVIYNSILLANFQDPITLGVKFLVSSGVLLLALASIFYMLNAPAQRNFGISTMQVLALLFAQWTYGSKSLEGILANMGEKVETFYGIVVFRNSKTKKLKALWLAPYVHFGPVGNLGGSEFPSLLSKPLSQKYGVPVSVYHATVNHDFNPVYSSLHGKFLSAYEKELQILRKGDFQTDLDISLLNSKKGSARYFGLTFGSQDAFIAISNAPNSTEDVEFPSGMIMMDKFKSRGLRNAMLVDMHNSKTDGSYFLAGTPEFFEFYDLIDDYKLTSGRKFNFGSFADPLEDFGLSQGIGKMGMIVSVFEIAGKRSATILIDANNVLPEFRREILISVLQAYKFDFVDILTTDTHSVNAISGIHNPLGKYCDHKALIARIKASVGSAIEDLEPTETAMSIKRLEIEVLGARRSPEVISTINSIVSIAKIFAPSILILSILLAFILSLAIK